ncbi:MAG: Methenyltetrahydrofolate cyclohydrolase [Elusimicrobia bacterium ADurb.Bin231]|nr:MAG: Methenyltetrahydrofolate cyclohydrolase [Elusimicrobia bacterium ADurb.Bin231]
MKYYASLPVKKFILELSEKTSVPGGGSASALTACAGISLLIMAGNYTLGKKGYENRSSEIKRILSKLKPLQKKTQTLIDLDIKAYLSFEKIYFRIKKSSDPKSKENLIAMDNAFKKTFLAPANIFDAAEKSVSYGIRLSEICNKNLKSDAICGITLLYAGIATAKINMDVNLNMIQDKRFAADARKRYDNRFKTVQNKIKSLKSNYL